MSELLDMLEAGMAGAARKLEPSCSRQHVHVCAAFPLIRAWVLGKLSLFRECC